jgi:sugar lactone lactonase YvrE
VALKRIDGSADDVELHAPKGMALADGVLWVSDIDVVRKFDAKTGKAFGSVPIDGASVLNDVTAATGGSVIVSDSGLGAKFQPTGPGAVYRIGGDGAVTTLLRVKDAGVPNGFAVRGDAWFLVTFHGAKTLREFAADNSLKKTVTLPAGNLDGLVALEDGTFLVSSWETGTAYAIDAAGKSRAVATVFKRRTLDRRSFVMAAGCRLGAGSSAGFGRGCHIVLNVSMTWSLGSDSGVG